MNRRNTILPALGMAFLLALPAGHGLAQSSLDLAILVGPIPGARLGNGFDLATGTVHPNVCVQELVDPNNQAKTYTSDTGVSSKSEIMLTTDTSQLQKDSGWNLGGGVSYSGVQAGGSVGFANEHSEDYGAMYIYASVLSNDPSVFPLSLKLKPEWEDKSLSQIANECGAGVIVGFKRGQQFMGLATANTSSVAEYSSWDVSAKVGVTGTQNNVEAGAASSTATAMGQQNFDVSVFSTDPNMGGVVTVDDMLAQFEVANTNPEKSVNTGMYVVSWNYIKQAAPTDDPFAGTDALTALSDILWDLRSLEGTLDYIDDYPEQFALGSDDAQRNAYLRVLQLLSSDVQVGMDHIQAMGRDCASDAAAVSAPWLL